MPGRVEDDAGTAVRRVGDGAVQLATGRHRAGDDGVRVGDLDGERIERMPDNQSVIHKCTPIYEELPGWKTDVSASTEPHHLPANARSYIEFLAEQCGVPISLLGVGPSRDQYVQLAS